MLQDEVRTKKYNLNILWIMIVLVILGIVNLYSATYSTATLPYWKKQIYFFGIGSFAAATIFFIHYRVLERFAYLAYGLNILLLILVILFGRTIEGSKRWLSFGPIGIQPSELMKITMAWVLAKYFHDDQKRLYYNLRDLLIPLLLILIPVLLIKIQPDLGTSLIVLAISGTILLFVKINSRLILSVGLIAVVLLPVAYKFVLKDYQKKRIVTFLYPQSDPRGAGYNSIQSIIAVGSGQFLGKGYKEGTQSQLKFLPEHHTDFIFSVFSEEHGFLGCLIVLALFLAFLLQGMKVAYSANDKFGMLFAVGIMSMFFWHITINIGMTVGLLPVVGVPLPFFSYGGSSMVSGMIAVGILVNIANRKSMF